MSFREYYKSTYLLPKKHYHDRIFLIPQITKIINPIIPKALIVYGDYQNNRLFVYHFFLVICNLLFPEIMDFLPIICLNNSQKIFNFVE